MFRYLLAHNRAPFSSFIRLEDHAVMSLSPERFLRLRAGEIQTRPIKGTLPRLADADTDRQQGSAWCGSIGYISCCGTDEEAEYQETLAKSASLYCRCWSSCMPDAVIERSLPLAEFITRFQLLLPETRHVTYYRRRAAVLILIICYSRPILLLTRRAASLRKHAGQVAFPWGSADADDVSAITTMLREAQDESR